MLMIITYYFGGILMAEFRIISITHDEDVDGIGSQSIAYRYFVTCGGTVTTKMIGEEIQQIIKFIPIRTDYSGFIAYWSAIFAKNIKMLPKRIQNSIPKEIKSYTQIMDYFYNMVTGTEIFDQKLKQILIANQDLYANPGWIVITDIGFNRTFEKLFDFWVESAFKIGYFDHHEIEQNVRDMLKKICTIYINDDIQTSAEIVREFFLSGDPIAQKISEYGSDADFNRFKIPETEKFQKIFNRKLGEEVLDFMMLSFAKGEFTNKMIDKIYLESKLWHDEQEKYLKTHTNVIQIEESKEGSIKFIIGSSGLRPGQITRQLQKDYKPDSEDIEKHVVYIGFNIDSAEVNLRSHNINTYKIARAFGGGGHRERSGFLLNKKYITFYEKGTTINPEKVNFRLLVNEIVTIINNSKE
jgi:oligoribonuclease NrnB/cAMP/cGMP phosphodiesterase (DHH superfamily)